MTQKEYERLLREAARAKCAVCEKPVEIEDRCEDGLYLHRECAYKMSSR